MHYNITQGKIIAIIPARGGSKGVQRKNVKNLGGFPLMAYSIVAAGLSDYINRIIVSTDDKEFAEIAKNFDAEIPFLRPAEFASDKSRDIDFMRHAIEWLQKNEGKVPEYFVHLRPTTPLREVSIVDNAISKFIHDDSYTSLRSAHPAPESPYKWFRLANDNSFKSFMENMTTDATNADRRDFPEAYIPDGYVDIVKSKTVINTGLLHGDRIMAYISPFCTEVDTIEEFNLLEYELKSKGSELYDYLCKNYSHLKGVE